jgi:hypothetical protein
MAKKSRRAEGLKLNKHSVKVPFFSKLNANDQIQKKDVWVRHGENPNNPRTTMVTVAEHEYGRTVKECSEVALGGSYWRVTAIGKEERTIPARKANS